MVAHRRFGGSCWPTGPGGGRSARGRSPRTHCSSERTAVIDLYTRTPTGTTVVCVDELGPLIPRAYSPQPGWTADGNRVKEEVAYWREPEKTWIYGGLRIRDGHAVTMCADRRNSICYQDFRALLEDENPVGRSQ
jgi:hypothetical protein